MVSADRKTKNVQHVETPLGPQSGSAPTTVVGFGFMCVDEIHVVDRLSVNFETEVRFRAKTHGGSAANTIYALAKLGVPTGLIGLVCDDKDGKNIIKSLQASNVDVSMVYRLPPSRLRRRQWLEVKGTDHADIYVDGQGSRMIFHHPGVNAVLGDPEFCPRTMLDAFAEYAERAGFLHLSSFPAVHLGIHHQSTFPSDLQLQFQCRLATKLSPAVRLSVAPRALYAKQGVEPLADLLREADMLFLYGNELAELTLKKTFTDCLNSIYVWRRTHDVEKELIIVADEGGEPLSSGTLSLLRRTKIATGKGRLQEVFEIDKIDKSHLLPTPVDTTGMADSFTAGVLFAMRRRCSLKVCANVGYVMAVLASSQLGAREGLPTLPQLERHYKEFFGVSSPFEIDNRCERANTISAGAGKGREKRFQVALSFPGEQRDYVEEVAGYLVKEFGKENVFYDRNFESELARLDLDTYLQKIYHDDSELIAVFMCSDYERKEWCGLEWRAIRDLIKKRKRSDIMPVRFDKTHVPGLFSIDGYVDIRGRPAEKIARLVIERYQISQGKRPSS